MSSTMRLILFLFHTGLPSPLGMPLSVNPAAIALYDFPPAYIANISRTMPLSSGSKEY
jgi:hypothetical protein